MTVRIAQWLLEPLEGTFDFSHYKAIHGRLFGDLYDWAGQIRTVDLSPKGTPFCPAGRIEERAAAIFFRLKNLHYLRGMEAEPLVEEPPEQPLRRARVMALATNNADTFFMIYHPLFSIFLYLGLCLGRDCTIPFKPCGTYALAAPPLAFLSAILITGDRIRAKVTSRNTREMGLVKKMPMLP